MGPRAVLTLLGVLLLATAGVLLVLGGDEEARETAASDSVRPPPVSEDVDSDALRSARALSSGFERVTAPGEARDVVKHPHSWTGSLSPG